MQKPILFRGAATALVTPFRDRQVDYPALGALIDRQMENNIDALCILGTTGESATLSHEERIAVFRFAFERIGARVPAIAGTGSPDTDYSVRLSRIAADIGYDGLLVVTPYYNKATPTGLLLHYRAIADAVRIPLLLYNVPSRTGVDIPLSVYRELAQHERIVGVKEASGNLSTVATIRETCGDALTVYSGNDDLTLPILSLGGAGVISVLGNLFPRAVHDLCAAWFTGNPDESARIQLRYQELNRALFSEVNPIPVKTALSMLGLCREEFRLPLCRMEAEKRERLRLLLSSHDSLSDTPI